jgi:type III secretory pathway lipoprotein EscJ
MVQQRVEASGMLALLSSNHVSHQSTQSKDGRTNIAGGAQDL